MALHKIAARFTEVVIIIIIIIIIITLFIVIAFSCSLALVHKLSRLDAKGLTDGRTDLHTMCSFMDDNHPMSLNFGLSHTLHIIALSLSLYSRPSNFIHFSHLCRHPAVHGRICEKHSCLCCGSTGAHRCTGDVETKDAVVTECSIFWSLQLGLVALLQVVWSDVGKLFEWNQ